MSALEKLKAWIIRHLPWVCVALNALACMLILFLNVFRYKDWTQGFALGMFYGFCPLIAVLTPIAWTIGEVVRRKLRGGSDDSSVP